jgi:LPXTG-motif cell wall-anchored protein
LKSAQAVLDGTASELTVEVFNNGPALAKNVTVTLSEGATVLAVKSIGALAGTSFKRIPLTWTPSTVGLHHLSVKVASSSVEASTANNEQITSLAVYASNAADGVLIVDDDDNFEMQQAYEAALLALGVPYAVTNRHPTLAELKRYKVVFWQNGVAQQEGNLSTEDRAALKSYLDGGGKVWFSGGWLAGALAAKDDTTYGSVTPGTDPTFAANYLGIGFVNRQTRAGGIAMPVAGFTKPIAYKPFPGRVNASIAKLVSSGAGDATKIYDIKAGDSTVGVGGTTVVGDSAHKNFRTVFTAFNLGTVVKPEDQIALVSAVLKQLSGASSLIVKTFTVNVGVASAPATIDAPVVLHVPVPWSRRGEAQVITATIGGTDVTSVELTYRRFLTDAYHTVSMTERAPGIYEAVLAGSVFQAPGVEYSITVSTPSGAIKLPRGQAGGYFVPVADGPASPELPYTLSSVLGARFKPAGVTGSRGGAAPRPVSPGRLPATGVGSGEVGFALLGLAAISGAWLRRRNAMRV